MSAPNWTEALAGYLQQRLPHTDSIHIRPAGPLPAGASNATLAIDARMACDGMSISVPLILRPERPDGILAPYDVARQFTIMRALGPTDVSVPTVAWMERDSSIIGLPFFLMGRLVGVRTPPLFWYGSGPAVEAAARALARVHEVDWRAAGLGQLAEAGSPSPLAAEMAAWRPRAERNGADRVDFLARLAEHLIAHEPDDADFRLTHGDTNAGNYLFRDDTVAAIVDWELSAIGDPRSDLGFYAALNTVFGGYGPEESPLTGAYARVTGKPPRSMEFYEAWGLYRMLMIFGGSRGWWHPYGTEAALQRLDEILGPAWRNKRG